MCCAFEKEECVNVRACTSSPSNFPFFLWPLLHHSCITNIDILQSPWSFHPFTVSSLPIITNTKILQTLKPASRPTNSRSRIDLTGPGRWASRKFDALSPHTLCKLPRTTHPYFYCLYLAIFISLLIFELVQDQGARFFFILSLAAWARAVGRDGNTPNMMGLYWVRMHLWLACMVLPRYLVRLKAATWLSLWCMCNVEISDYSEVIYIMVVCGSLSR